MCCNVKDYFRQCCKKYFEKKNISIERKLTGLWICFILVVIVFVKRANGSVNGAKSFGWGS